jgi:hypothetical protein
MHVNSWSDPNGQDDEVEEQGECSTAKTTQRASGPSHTVRPLETRGRQIYRGFFQPVTMSETRIKRRADHGKKDNRSSYNPSRTLA